MATWALVGGFDRPYDQRQAWRDEARVTFDEIGDDFGLAMFWWSTVDGVLVRTASQETLEACERALEHLERAGAAESRLAHLVVKPAARRPSSTRGCRSPIRLLESKPWVRGIRDCCSGLGSAASWGAYWP